MPQLEGKSTYTLVGDWFTRATWQIALPELPSQLGDPAYSRLEVTQIGQVVAQCQGDLVVEWMPLTHQGETINNQRSRTLLPKHEFFGNSNKSQIRLYGTEQEAITDLPNFVTECARVTGIELSYALWSRTDRRNERKMNYGDLGAGLGSGEATTPASNGALIDGLHSGQTTIVAGVLTGAAEALSTY